MTNQVSDSIIDQAYELAKQRYAQLGVDTEKAMAVLANIPISLHCWQGDDVTGFESDEGLTGGGIQATGNYPGKARTPDELRADLDKTLALIPGTHRLNLHAMYAEFDGGKVERNQLKPEHFKNWIEWAKAKGMGLDFNPTLFSHPMADSGFTLSNYDDNVRQFWIEHCIACRKIAEEMGKQLGTPTVTNIWIPDGFKDIPIDRKTPRDLLRDSLDKILAVDVNKDYCLDAVECKLFGIGAESCTIGSHEFYMGYAIANKTLLCLDAGHFHPTEVISDKISSVLGYIDELLLHVSRPVRWDSDHVVILDDELRNIALEIVRNGYLERVHIGLDFFDASINRIAAWVIGTRNMIKALLYATLEPTDQLRAMEKEGNYSDRLAILEECKTLPFSAVWDYYCKKSGVPVGMGWMDEVSAYSKEALASRT